MTLRDLLQDTVIAVDSGVVKLVKMSNPEYIGAGGILDMDVKSVHWELKTIVNGSVVPCLVIDE